VVGMAWSARFGLLVFITIMKTPAGLRVHSINQGIGALSRNSTLLKISTTELST
jgi:hypothetical protein